MKLTSDSDSLARDKILILYILNKVDKPISNDSLLNLGLKITDMNFFYFQQFLIDLLENGYIDSFEKNDSTFYQITEQGKETLSLTQDILPGITKLHIDNNFKTVLENFEDQHSIISEYNSVDSNFFNVNCKIVDKDDIIFELKTFAGSREQAQIIVDNWKNNAQTIYPKILELLINSNK